MNYYNKDIKEIFKELNTNEKGLSNKEVLKRQQDGLNEIKYKGKVTPLIRFLSQFNNIMVILLLVVGILSFIYSKVTNTEYTDAIVILFSVVVNTFMGYFQEKKAEDSLEALKSYVPTNVEVIREGINIEIDAKDLVKGDIVVLESGDKIPADCRIIEAISLKTDEGVLTGESVSVEKNADVIDKEVPIHERANMIYSGTIVETGKVIAVVTEIGNNTELGKIAKNLAKEKDAKTTLELKVERVSKAITFIAAILIAIVIVYGVVTHQTILNIIMLCISMIVATVPESLPIAITATLSVGSNQMAKKKAIVKKLSAIETLGATEIICSDKTGTLTTNQMTVMRITEGIKLKLNIRDVKDKFLLYVMALCNNASKDKKDEYYGDSVEVAFIKYLKLLGKNKKAMEDKNKRITEIPFDSDRKMMSTINTIDGKKYILTKGSASSVLSKCTKYRENGKVRGLNLIIKTIIKKQEKDMSKDALKVIALAYKPIKSNSDEKDLIFVGLVGLIDPPRSDVKEAIEKCNSAGVSQIMITGDSLETAAAIAKEIGIIKNNKECLLGEKIRNVSDKELGKILSEVKVFARVTPEDKVRIVTYLQKTGKVIAMTGDGVNDAPAIKLASVGIGMGKTGSDVTKGASDIILLDDSFSSVVTAIEEGRRIYDNVINNILYNLSSNFAEIFIILFGMFTFKHIIAPIHVLYIDLVADAIPSICLAFELASKNVMKRKPIGLNQKLFTPYFTGFLFSSVVIEVFISMFIFYIFEKSFSLELAQTLALLSVVINEFVFAYNCRSINELIIERKIFSNKQLNIGILVLLIVQLFVFLTPIGRFFGLVRITVLQFIFVLLINLIGFILIEITKPFIKRFINLNDKTI